MIASRATLSALRAGTAMAAALAFAGVAAPALGQGFNGTVTGSSGVVISGADITVLGSEAVINWNANAASATDTNVDFLSAGQSVLFHDMVSGGSGDFTVLNRVTTTYSGSAIPATISFSGTVNSQVQGATGGNIWFYSPYGIIANGTSVFNVGSLLLTTSDIQLNAASGSLYLDQTNGNQIGFQQANQTGSYVRVLPGAQITASNGSLNSAYVGLFAPRIEQGGSIRSDGMTALVAGEAGTITFNAGLVDITVLVGTGDANGVIHTGSTGGTASLMGENKTVALVAVPKNTALTMLLSGSLGNDAAGASAADNSSVELYAGSTAQADAVRPNPAHLTVTTPVAEWAGNIAIGNTTFVSATEALATGDITVYPVYAGVNNPGLVDFRQTTLLFAGRSVAMTAQAGETIQAGGSLFIGPMLRRTGEDVTLTVTGDPAGLVAPGQITVANFLGISADGAPDPSGQTVGTNGAGGTGGDVAISVSQGVLSAGAGMEVTANGFGEDGFVSAGSGTGGTIDIGVSNSGTLLSPSFTASASGLGGKSFAASAGASAGGDGIGGELTLHDDGGTLGMGDVNLFAEGIGGSGSVSSGDGLGGTLAVRITGASQNWTSLNASASALSGDLQSTTTTGGNAAGLSGGLLVAVSGSGALTTDSLVLDNGAYINIGGTQAQSASAGDIDVQVSAGGTLVVNSVMQARANADQGPDVYVLIATVAPTMTGGRVNAVADGGTIDADAIVLEANAVGFAAASGTGLAQGGTATLGARGGGLVTLLDAVTNRVSAEAYGAVGPAAANAIGGTARVFADNGTVRIRGDGAQDIAVSASALSGGVDFGGSTDGNGFNATGGTASIDVLGGTGDFSAGLALVYAKGEASVVINPQGAGDLPGFSGSNIIGIAGDGGTGTGGTAQVNVLGGSWVTTTLRVNADGIGGASAGNANGAAYQSGKGQGGNAYITQSGGTFANGLTTLRAKGQGGQLLDPAGSAANPANGGEGSGGIARMTLSAGTMTLGGIVTISADAAGGAGMATGGSAAGGAGGRAANAAAVAELLMPLGSSASLSAPGIAVSASALGGAGGAGQVSFGPAGAGGEATAGTARISLADGAIAASGAVNLLADATGGAGSVGGNATGGIAAFSLTDSLAAPATTRSLGSLFLLGSSAGGTGATAADEGTATAGTTRFTAQAGRAASALAITGNLSAFALGGISPAGDGFTGNFGAIPVSVGGNAAILTTRDLNATTLSGGGLNVAGGMDLFARTISISGPGVLAAAGNVTAQAFNSINLGGLSSSGTTRLEAFNPVTGLWGPVNVARLTSTGPVTAFASAFGAVSPGALTFADSFATTGDFTVLTAGNLGVGTITAPGQINLSSTTGTLSNTGPLSGGSVVLNAGGAIAVDGAITSQSAFTATGGGALTATAPIGALGAVSIDTAGGITVPSLSSGGTTFLRASAGAIALPDLLSAGAVTLLGRSASVISGGPLNFTSAVSTAGDLVLTAAGNLLVSSGNATGAASLTSTGGTVNAPSLSATGLVTANGTSVTIGSPSALAFANSAASSGAFTVTTSGNLAVADISAPGAVSLSSTAGNLSNTGALDGGSVVLNAGGAIAVDGPITAQGTFTATGGGALGATAAISALGAVSIDAAGGITVSSLSSGGTTFLRASGGAISVGNLLSSGPLTVSGRSASVTSSGSLTVTSATTTAGGLLLASDGNLIVTSADATGAVTLTSATGTVSAPSLSATGPVVASGRAVTIASPGSLSFGTSAASAGNFTVNAAGDLTFANVSASGAIALTAGGFAAFNGLASAPTVALSSGDIRIGNTGQLGQRGVTNTIALTNTAPAAGTAIGGAAAASGWSLDAAEALRLFAEQGIAITVPANASTAAPVTIGSLAISYGAGVSPVGLAANIGSGGSFTVDTPGVIRVTGAVAPVLSGNSDLFALTAGQRIDVVTDTGSIVLKNGNNVLTGTLRMTAPTVRVATTSALSALDSITSLSAASARLDSNDGLVNTAGTIQANALEFNVAASTLYIQNSGTDTQAGNRRGFAANSLSIDGLAGAQPSFAINGLLFGSQGQAITGLATAASIVVNDSFAAAGGDFNPLSTVNGCAVGQDCSFRPELIAPPQAVLDDLSKVLTAGAGADAQLNLPVVQFGETPLLNSPPLIDEPVTGVGNDDLWLKPCGADKDCAE